MFANMSAPIVFIFASYCEIYFQGPFYLSYDLITPSEEIPVFNLTY